MANRVVRVCVTSAAAILLAGAIFGARAAQAATWRQTAAGTYRWTAATNWDAAFPNAPGAAADLNAGLQGSLILTLDRAITVGTLIAGDRGGAAGSTTAIGSGTGGNPLTFEGSTPGVPAAIRFSLSAPPASGVGLNLACGVRLGGTSPLTATVDSTAVFDCSIGAVDLNGNTFTLAGPPRTNDGSGATGIAWQVATIAGNGHFVLNGAGARLLNPCPNFTGALTINHGWFWFETASLRNASRFTIAGAFTNHKKYPRGGKLQIGAGWPAVAALPDRLNHQATMVFRGGFLEDRGQALASSLRGQAVVEQVRQIEFASGMSEISMQNGNNVSSSTILLANDPTRALVRRQGATLMIGGDDARSAKGMSGAIGVAEKLIFASGASAFLKGGGGAAGSKSVSIIPWITLGTFYHPGQGKFVTYDRANGIRCLTDSEYFAGTVLGCPPDSNVSGAKLNLGTNKTQTINAYTTEAWDNTDIGPGSTLTVASGVIRFGSGPAGIGNGNPANAGTIDFGPAEGIIWTGFDTPYGPNCIGSAIAGTGGLTLAGNNVLVLKAANTYTGKTCVGSGILQVGDGTLTHSRLGNGDVEVAAGGTLRIKARVANAISDAATVSLGNTGDVFFGVMDLDSGIDETVAHLLLDGKAQPAGAYGSTASAAAHKLDQYFTGPGILTVASQKGAVGPSGQPGPKGPVSRPEAKLPEGVNALRGVEFAKVGGKSLQLDIYTPTEPRGKLPLVVWIFGGAWRGGSKEHGPGYNAIGVVVPHGYAMACISHRFSQEAIFPAQIEDCKAAIRFLRANAAKYSIDGDHIGVWGESSGGHLSALLGTSGGVQDLEGRVGDNLGVSSRVQCVVDYCGPSDFMKFAGHPTWVKVDDPRSPVCQLVGGLLADRKALVARANPITYITKDDPPFLVAHADKDNAVPFNQSELLVEALKKAGVDVTFEVIQGGGHNFGQAQYERLVPIVIAFFDKHLKGAGASQPVGRKARN